MSSALFGLTCPLVPGSVESPSERTLQQAFVVGRFTLPSQPPIGGDCHNKARLCPEGVAHQAIKAPTTSSTPKHASACAVPRRGYQSCLCVPEREPVPFDRSTRRVMYLPACALQGAPFRVFANARLGHCSCLLSDTRQFSGMYLPAPSRVSACTRPPRGRVHKPNANLRVRASAPGCSPQAKRAPTAGFSQRAFTTGCPPYATRASVPPLRPAPPPGCALPPPSSCTVPGRACLHCPTQPLTTTHHQQKRQLS
jgi:hypothetical protein